MKIAIISTARTRSTALASYISKQHPDLKYLWEVYTAGLQENNYTIPLETLTHNLFDNNENFIIKILGQNISLHMHANGFVGEENVKPQRLFLERYDKFHLIERHNFFHQLCSYTVAYNTRVYNRNKSNARKDFDEVKSKKYKIALFGTSLLVGDIIGYMKIKKYLIDNHMPFQLYDSETDITHEISDIASSQANDFDYSQLIENYYELKPIIEPAFSKYFNYDLCKFDYNSFVNEIRPHLS
jgi:hypothetical protein